MKITSYLFSFLLGFIATHIMRFSTGTIRADVDLVRDYNVQAKNYAKEHKLPDPELFPLPEVTNSGSGHHGHSHSGGGHGHSHSHEAGAHSAHSHGAAHSHVHPQGVGV